MLVQVVENFNAAEEELITRLQTIELMSARTVNATADWQRRL